MLDLLPPSEGKAEPGAGAPVDLGSLAFAEEMGERREAVLDAFDPALREAPAAPAADVYTGVLFKRLELPQLPAEVRRQVLIFSALWGVVRPDDPIPHYKLPTKTRLKRIGAPAAYWRPVLTEALPDKVGELIVDMRSGAYSSFWSRSGRRCWRCAPSPSATASARPSPTWRRRAEATSRGCCCRRRRRQRIPGPLSRSPGPPASPSSTATEIST